MIEFPTGLYDLLNTTQLHNKLQQSGLLDRAILKDIDAAEFKHRLSLSLAKVLAQFIAETASEKNEDAFLKKLTEQLESHTILESLLDILKPHSIQSLQEIKSKQDLPQASERPDTPLSVSALLTGSSRTPALRSQIIKELSSCDRADWLVSFIKFSGIRPLLPALKAFTQTPHPDGGPRLRIATTSYLGATDIKAIEELLKLPHTEIRISYDTKRTRLHAKAYLFHRETGFGSAYIGSANVSKAALDEGLEWTAKISQYELEYLWKHSVATFESHWEDQTEFTPCNPDNLDDLKAALSHEREHSINDDQTMSFFDIRPYGYQQMILDDIYVERQAGKHKHLVIAATGTGKTMIAAFDYKQFCKDKGGQPRLLFVAHREEILRQARQTYRHILRDGSFGDLVLGGNKPEQQNHLFCSVQSWNSQGYNKYAPEYFDYVVLDEAHHAAADSYQKLIQHIQPQTLLGLTATPERSDGQNIQVDFDGAFTHEIRLPEAIERRLLSPFHYYGIPDLDGLDFSSLAWKQGGYDKHLLEDILAGNKQRANWVMSQTELYVNDIKKVRGLGFCVSVAHANFMAKLCNENRIPAVALSSESTKDLRHQAQRKLEQFELNFIFTVDLYNEGIDIPCVDTVLFLRPTESLTVFLQQLGRGLRLHETKSQLTVLDFIAPHHRKFNFSQRYRALSSRPDIRIDNQIEADMPFVPTGCFLHLERQAKEHILNNIKANTSNLRGQTLLNELRQIQGERSLEKVLDYLTLDNPDELYKRDLPSTLFAQAHGETIPEEIIEWGQTLADGFRRLLLMTDTFFIQDAKNLIEEKNAASSLTKSFLHCVLWGNKKPNDGSLEAAHQFCLTHPGVLKDLTELLAWLLKHYPPLPKHQFQSKTGPLNLHASYTREQVLLALELGKFEEPKSMREGVFDVKDKKIDLFFADINKSEADFSPSTMYEDYAITDKLFHWQSQAGTSEHTEVGKRYINHQQLGYTPMLFIRNRKKTTNKLTAPFVFVGPLKYVKHEGEKPMSITWELEYALPAKILSWARRI